MFNEYGEILLEENPEEMDLDYNPGSELILAETNPLKSEVMFRAGELREEGYSPSSALRTAWSEVKGEGNPAEFEPSPLLIVLAAVAVGLGIYRWKENKWPWSLGRIRRPLLRAANPGCSGVSVFGAHRSNIMTVPAPIRSFEGLGMTRQIYASPNPSQESISLVLP